VLKPSPVAGFGIRSSNDNPGEQLVEPGVGGECTPIPFGAGREGDPSAKDALQDGAALRRGAAKELPCVDPLVNPGDHHRCGHHDRRPDFTAVVDDHQPLFDHDAGSRLKPNDACTVGVHFHTCRSPANPERFR
jgi:hypothetical protein